jgi:hypothetical protein
MKVHRISVLLLPMLAAWMAACEATPRVAEPGVREVPPEVDRPRAVFSQPRTPVAFQGVVLERKKSDGYWSGVLEAYQAVRYRVESVESGPMAPTGEVLVFHALVGPPLCEADVPELSQAVFKVGQRLHVKAERTAAGDYVCGNDPQSVRAPE